MHWKHKKDSEKPCQSHNSVSVHQREKNKVVGMPVLSGLELADES